MKDTLPTYLKLAAVSSLALSLIVATLSFFAPRSATIPLALLNWCLFLTVTYLATWSLPRLGSFSAVDAAKVKVWAVVFLAFTISGWTALAM